jgi:hypothetical protein
MSGVAQLPLVTDAADPHEIGDCAKRTSYLAGCPLPSSTWVNARITFVLSREETPRFVTVPGLVVVGGAAVTVIAALPTLLSLVALICAVPAATPVTSPVLETVAMLLLVEAQVMPRPLRTLPFASFVIAASCRVDLACTAALAGETVTDATGIGEDATVVPSTTFESSPKMAPAFRVPRNATSSKLYFVTGLSPATVQVNADPIAFPESGVVHVPDVVELAEPHESGETA